MQKTILSLIAACLLANVSHSAVFERDLVPGSGDGLLTFDDVNNREWLDLSETLLVQYAGDSIATRFQAVIDETAPSGDFSGFIAATEADVLELAESAGIDIATASFAINETPANHFVDLLSPTLGDTPGSWASYGFVSDLQTAVWVAVTQTGTAGLSRGMINFDPGGIPSLTGVWLFRQVPEPSVILLSMQAFMLTAVRRRRNSF